MTDNELLALTALVNQETSIFQIENQFRLMDNYSPSYFDFSNNYKILEEELKRRNIIK